MKFDYSCVKTKASWKTHRSVQERNIDLTGQNFKNYHYVPEQQLQM